jgi:hypothetical protein
MLLPECIILQQEAANPTTSGERLVKLAQRSTELSRLVANNSNCFLRLLVVRASSLAGIYIPHWHLVHFFV